MRLAQGPGLWPGVAGGETPGGQATASTPATSAPTAQTSRRPFLIGVEEPENGIYPGRVRALVDLLVQETQRRIHEEPKQLAEMDEEIAQFWGAATAMGCDLLPTQILLTTHSPVILAALRKHPQHLRYVDTVHRDGRRATRARAVGRAGKAQRHLVISPREIEQLLNVVSTEDPG